MAPLADNSLAPSIGSLDDRKVGARCASNLPHATLMDETTAADRLSEQAQRLARSVTVFHLRASP